MIQKPKRWHEMCLRGARVVDDETGEVIPVRRRSDAVRFFRAILGRYEPRQTVTDPSDVAWLGWLLEGSQAAQQFHGTPPYAFTIHSNADLGYPGKAQGFSVTRFDASCGLLGTTVDPFSVPRLLSNQAKEEEELIVRAFRAAVEDQLVHYRHALLSAGGAGIVCPYTNEPLHAGNAYVAHIPLLKDIVQQFLSEAGIDRVHLRYASSLYLDLAPGEVRERWRTFHAQNGLRTLALVSFNGHYAALREAREQEQRVQDVRLMALRSGR